MSIFRKYIGLIILISPFGCKQQGLVPIKKDEVDCIKICGDCLLQTHEANLVPNGSFECYCSKVLIQSTNAYSFAFVCGWNQEDSLWRTKNKRALSGPPRDPKVKDIHVYETIPIQYSELFLGSPDYYQYDPSDRLMQFQAADSLSFAGINVLGRSVSSLQRGREYIQIRLSEKLEKDSIYSVSFQYNLKDMFGEIKSYSSNALGFLFTDTLIYTTDSRANYSDIGKEPTAYSEFVIDSLPVAGKWYTYAANYKAEGGEEFITIGDFRKEKLKYLVPDTRSYHSYFFIDNVIVQ